MKVQAKHGKVTQNMHGANRNYIYVWDVSLVPFLHMHIILVVLHKLLQRIIRRDSNRSNYFNNFVITRKISTTRLLRKLRKVKFIWLTIEFNRNLTFLAIYYSSTSAEERPTKDNRAKTILH